MKSDRWRQVEQLYHSAQKIPADRRGAFLKEQCLDDDLLRKEVESLLSYESAAHEFIETPAFEVAARLLAEEEPGEVTVDSVGIPHLPRFHVTEKLGRGGMGIVYKAQDTKLRRPVALKFLPPELARDPQALERFQREAYAASALNHPNICTVYDVDQYQDQPFIAMEFLEGQTLERRIGGRPLPTLELLDLASQISEGLNAAHTQSILHRDIKPSNIFVTTSGQVKILDFGLAKKMKSHDFLALTGVADSLAGDIREGTLTTPGAAIGTVAYMSPEQARGEELDSRTDLFSLGAVLYEMATASPPFSGSTSAVIFEAILNRTPVSVANLNPELPTRFAALISKALEKDRDLRYQHASEISADLKALRRDLESGPKTELSPSASAESPRLKSKVAAANRGFKVASADLRRRNWLVAVGGILAVLLVATSFWFSKRQPAGLPAVKLRQLTRNSRNDPVRSGSISPDGKYLAYADRQGIHIEVVASGESHVMPQSGGAKATANEWFIPGWFPDSTHFLVNLIPPLIHEAPNRQTSIWVASVLGGAPRMLRDKAEACSVSPDGHWINFKTHYGRFGAQEIWVMNSIGEDLRKLYETNEENLEITCGPWSPDGQHFLSATASGLESLSDIQIRDLKGSAPRTILSSKPVTEMMWLRDGRFIYSLEEQDGAGSCNFWEMKLNAAGEPTSSSRRLTSWAGFCMDYVSSTSDDKQLVFKETKEHATVFVAAAENDGKRLSPRQLTFSEGWDIPVAWTPDSKAVIFTSNRAGNFSIYVQALDSEFAEPLVSGTDNYLASCVSPDGRWLLYNARAKNDSGSAPDRIMRVPIAGGPVEPVLMGQVSGIWCSNARGSLCAISERTTDRKQLVFTAFDPIKGRGQELARLETEPSADYAKALAPDGRHIAVVKRLGDGTITILSVSDGTKQDIPVKGWTGLEAVSWAADSRSLFVTKNAQRRSILLAVDLRGNVRELWTEQGGEGLKAVSSPDGRHLALFSRVADENMWMMENF